MTFFVGVDVGGTTSTVAIGNERREVVYVSEQFATRSAEGPRATLLAIVEQLQAGMARVAGDSRDVCAVGLATPGPATLDGMLLKTPNLNPQFWDRFPIRAELEQALHQQHISTKVHYLGDGQAAALGEFAVRTGNVTWSRSTTVKVSADLKSLFMAIVGTGLGGGEVLDGRMVRGREGRAGHVGHILLPDYAFRYEHDRRLVVGNAMSTMESAVSLTGLAHQLAYRLTLEGWHDHPLQREPGTVRDKAKRLRNMADAGDRLALELLDDQARALGIGMLSVNYLGDYDVLVIGGGVCDLSGPVRDRYRQLANESYLAHALDGFKNFPGFEFSVCGDEAPVIGALAHAWAAVVA